MASRAPDLIKFWLSEGNQGATELEEGVSPHGQPDPSAEDEQALQALVERVNAARAVS